jgi:hypothetical protein
MTDETKPITRQAVAAQGRSGKLTVSGKLKVALDAMLFEGACRPDAAKTAGMTDHSLRSALKKVHVKQYYNAGLEVLRTSTRARNILRLDAIADNAGNDMARVAAIKTLEALDEQERQRTPGGVGRVTAPGLIIVVNAAPQSATVIDVTPNTATEDDRH